MGFFQFGSRIKNRSFDFIPRYYDPDKEELEERLKRYNREPGDVEISKQRIKGGFRRKYRVEGIGDYSKKETRRSNRVLLLTLGILLLLSFYFISAYLPRIVAALE